MRRKLFLSSSLSGFICTLGLVTLFWLLAVERQREAEAVKTHLRFIGRSLDHTSLNHMEINH